MNKEYFIRKMKEGELQIAVDWAQKEGWNPGLYDRQCFYQADPNGFFIGLLNDEPIATGSAVVYDDHFAFCGLYIVKKDFRGQGYGLQLTHVRLKHVGNRITGIDGVVENETIYQRIGYRSAHKSIRYELTAKQSFSFSGDVVELKQISFEQLEKFDRLYFPAPRSNFLRAWISQPECYALGIMESNRLQGYGVMRKCFKGNKIGPLFAETLPVAQAIFEGLCSKVHNGPIYLDVPEPNRNALNLVKQYQMAPMFEVMRMYRNGMPRLDLQGIYGFTTFELG